jgi:predicted O-linked N-acetylglucosamine transferase (SPINDLY family)
MVEQIIADKIHILVNLGGYTKGARNEVFAVRPCPVQVALMGYAGTSAACAHCFSRCISLLNILLAWCDYLIADAHAAPAMSFAPYRQAVRKEEGQETLRMQDGFAELDLESEITEENADPESFSLDWTL